MRSHPLPGGNRIEANPSVLVGKPIIRGTRVPVSLILNDLEHGHAVEERISDHPVLTREDIDAAVAYARAERAQARNSVRAG